MIEAIIVMGTDKINEIRSIREACYKDELYEMKANSNLEADKDAYHVIVYEDQIAVAVGRLIIEPEYMIDQILVLKNYRKRYYGDLIAKMLIDKGFNLGAKEITAIVPVSTLGFFKRIGFYELGEKIDSDFKKIGINKESIKKCKH